MLINIISKTFILVPPYFFLNLATSNIIPYVAHVKINAKIPIPIGIQSGDNTHHQLQAITLHNFKIINANVSNPVNPVPIVIVFFFSIFSNLLSFTLLGLIFYNFYSRL